MLQGTVPCACLCTQGERQSPRGDSCSGSELVTPFRLGSSPPREAMERALVRVG